MLGINRNTLRAQARRAQADQVSARTAWPRGDSDAGADLRLRQDRRRRVRARARRRSASSSSRPAARRRLLADAGLAGHRGRRATPAFRRCSTAASRRCTRRSTAACSRAATSPRTCAALARARHRARSTSWSSTSIRSRRPSRSAGCTLDDAIENIDIGGPAMVRSAAKNWTDVARGRRPVALRRRRSPSSRQRRQR